MDQKIGVLEIIEECFPEETFLYPTGYEDCIVGVELESRVLIMDCNKIINKIVEVECISLDDATEFFNYNILGSGGEGYPIYSHIFK